MDRFCSEARDGKRKHLKKRNIHVEAAAAQNVTAALLATMNESEHRSVSHT